MHFRRIIDDLTRSFIDHSIIGWVNLIEMWANPTWRIWCSSSLHVRPSLTCWTLASVEEQVQHTHSHWCRPISLSSLGYKSVISPRMPHSTVIHSYSVCYSTGKNGMNRERWRRPQDFQAPKLCEIMGLWDAIGLQSIGFHKHRSKEPEASKSLKKTKNFSFAIWLSVKRNMTPSSFSPALLYMYCRSVLRSPRPYELVITII